jgi:hypothetical protein
MAIFLTARRYSPRRSELITIVKKSFAWWSAFSRIDAIFMCQSSLSGATSPIKWISISLFCKNTAQCVNRAGEKPYQVSQRRWLHITDWSYFDIIEVTWW